MGLRGGGREECSANKADNGNRQPCGEPWHGFDTHADETDSAVVWFKAR